MSRLVVMMVVGLGLGGCASYFQPEMRAGGGIFPFGSAPPPSALADQGLAAMAKGDYPGAEKFFLQALKRDPRNVHALLGQGMIYQNTGQTTKAREMFEAILAIRPDKDQRLVVWNTMTTRPIADIASVNLALLESGGVLTGLGREPGIPSATGISPKSGPSGMVPGAASGSIALGREGMASPAAMGPEGMPPGGQATTLSGGDANTVSRFQTLIALKDQGLLTEEEYAVRRQANLGALLPLTTPPPAAGLDRPVPTAEQISARLRAIGRALEMRAISITQHTAERTMTLDALLPAAPVAVANPGVPPKGLMEAADTVRRLEYLRSAGLISSDEYTRERAAVEGSVQERGAVPARTSASAPAESTPTQAALPSGVPGPAVHLASYRSREAATKGWNEIRRKLQAQLGGLKPDIARVDLGPGKGVFFRLKAGPLKSNAEAKSLCDQLKRRGQFCEPSFMGSN